MFRHASLVRTLIPLRPAFQAVGLHTTAGYDQIHRKVFPEPIKDGRRSLVPSDELEAVIAARIAGRTESEIRALVERMHAQRQAGADVT